MFLSMYLYLGSKINAWRVLEAKLYPLQSCDLIFEFNSGSDSVGCKIFNLGIAYLDTLDDRYLNMPIVGYLARAGSTRCTPANRVLGW